MTIDHRALPYVRAISPYVPGKPITELAREYGLASEHIVKLASNENPRGMSPQARQAVSSALAENSGNGVERYPDQFALIQALSEHHQVDTRCIVLGNGSNDVLDLAARVFLSPGRSSVFSAHAFAVYPLATMATGAQCIVAPAREYGHDLRAMRAAIQPETALVWIANPNNPTGTLLSAEALYAFIAQIPPGVVVVLDEAYNDYLPSTQRIDTTLWLHEFPHLIITRTFSKIYGLAGLRVGYALASAQIAELMNRVRQPFNVSNLALSAAVAALGDEAFVSQSRALNDRGMAQITGGLRALGLRWIPSAANFVSVEIPHAHIIHEALLRQGVIVRPLTGYQMPNHLRVTIGLEHENARFLDTLNAALSSPTAAPTITPKT